MLAVRPAGSALSIPVNLVVRAPPSFRHAERVDLQVPSDMYMIDVLRESPWPRSLAWLVLQ